MIIKCGNEVAHLVENFVLAEINVNAIKGEIWRIYIKYIKYGHKVKQLMKDIEWKCSKERNITNIKYIYWCENQGMRP